MDGTLRRDLSGQCTYWNAAQRVFLWWEDLDAGLHCLPALYISLVSGRHSWCRHRPKALTLVHAITDGYHAASSLEYRCNLCAGENWTAAKKASDKKDLEQLPAGFQPPRSALSAVNGMLRRLMTLGELNLYNYSGGMPALYGSREANGKVNGTALGKAEKVNGVPYKVTGIARDLVQVCCHASAAERCAPLPHT